MAATITVIKVYLCEGMIVFRAMELMDKSAQGVMVRVTGSIIILAGFLVGSLIYIAFYTSGFSLFQKVVVFLVAFIIAVAAIAIMWVAWAGRRGWIRGWWAA